MASVSLRKIVKIFGDNKVVNGVDLEIEHNEFIVLVGPSGCAKSTILRMIAGLEDITEGKIAIDDHVINELAPKDRDIAMVFQDYALYPHLNVFRNMAFGLEMKKLPAAEIKKLVLNAAKSLNIEELLNRKPKQLSGGQRQRVAIGRAIVRNPKVFLFDEPLSNLDAKLRSQMRTEIKKLHRAIATTVIYVTHDQVEAMTMADRMVVLRDGSIEQIGKPDEIYNQPLNLFVASFIGAPTINFIPARLVNKDHRLALELKEGIVLFIPDSRTEHYNKYCNKEVILGLRPDVFSLAVEEATAKSENSISSQISVIEPLGSETLYFFNLGFTEIVAQLPPLQNFNPGDLLPLKIDMHKMHLFDPSTEKRLELV